MTSPYYVPPPPPRSNNMAWILGILGTCGGCALILIIVIGVAISKIQKPSVVHFARASMLQNSKKYAEAEKEWKLAYEMNKNDGFILNSYAWCLYLEGKNVEAEPLALKAVKIAPEEPSYIDTLAHVHLGLKKYDLAEKEFKHALKIDPTMGASLQGMGNILEHRKEYAKALESYKSAQNDPNSLDNIDQDIERVQKLIESTGSVKSRNSGIKKTQR